MGVSLLLAAAAVDSGGVPVGDIAVGWIDAGGQRKSDGLESVAEFAFEDVLPAREFLSYRGQWQFPGLWSLETTGRHVGYESCLERDHVMALDFDCDVTGVSSQPFALS
jgi:hypothetical protein